MKKKGQVKDLILWTFLAIVLGMIVSMAFLPLLGVNPIEATKIMFTRDDGRRPGHTPGN